MNGTVDPNGRDTTFYFEYGTSTSYGTKTAVRSAGAGTSPQNEATAIANLQVGRTYHFRIVATSDAGTATGADATFKTSSAPTVVTADASPIAVTTATLRGQVTPNGLSTTWWFEYGTSTSYGSKTASHSAGSGTSARAVSAGITRLAAAKSYHFRLVAQNPSGRVFGLDRLFTTVGPPTAATGAAQGVGADTAQLTGSVDTRGRSTTWWFDYGTSTKYGKSTPHRSAGSRAGAQTVVGVLTSLAANATYHYRLVARSDAGTTYGTDATFTTSGVSLSVAARQVVFGGRVRADRLGADAPGRGAGDRLLQGVRSGLVQLRRDGADGNRRGVDVPRTSADRDVVPGELAQRTQRDRLRRRPPARDNHALPQRALPGQRLRRAHVRAPGGSAAAPSRDALGDDQARAARSAFARRVPGDDSEGALDGPRRVQRQPGGPRLPGRPEPHADLHEVLVAGSNRG